MIIYNYENYTLKIFQDFDYTIDSTDTINIYQMLYFGDDSKTYKNATKYGIRLYFGNEEISNCIIIASGGATSLHKTSSVKKENQFMICCGDTVFCLDTLNLSLIWSKRLDLATVFQIIELDHDFIIHGELSISRINSNGEVVWSFTGDDIFITSDSSNELEIFNDSICVKDFNNLTYKISYQGQLLD